MNTYEISSDLKSSKVDRSERDGLISKLKSYIFELETNEKDYEALKEKYRQLQNDYTLLSESKLRLEFELKQKEDVYKKEIFELRSDLENLSAKLDEKNAINKKLFADNDILSKQLDMKNEELSKITMKMNDYSGQLDKTLGDKVGLEKMIQNLTDLKTSQKMELNKLNEDNARLSQVLQNQDADLKLFEQERIRLSQQLNEKTYDLANLNGKLHDHCDQIAALQEQLDQAKSINFKLNADIRELEHQNDNLKLDNENLKINLQKETTCRVDEQKRSFNLGNILNNKDRDIDKLLKENEMVKSLHMKVAEEKTEGQIENQKLRDHIIILTNQNEKLSSELQTVLEEDQAVLDKLDRGERLGLVLKANKFNIENSLNALDSYLSEKTVNKKKDEIEESENK